MFISGLRVSTDAVGTTLPFLGSAIDTSHVEEHVCAAFALIFHGHTRRDTGLMDVLFVRALFRSVTQYTPRLNLSEDWQISEADFKTL